VAEARERLLALRAQVDDLLRFRDELRSSAQDLIADYRTVLDGGEAQEAGVLLDAGPFGELATLASFEQALTQIPEVQKVHVRSFQEGRAQVELTLDRPVPLIERMRAVLDHRFTVTGAAPDRVTIELEPLATGTGAP
jgi:hypothetical protein